MAFIFNEDVETDNRYDFEKFIEQVSTPLAKVYDPTASFFLAQVRKLDVAGTTKVGAADQYRPDNLSYSLYGTVDYWALLMWYNDVSLYTELVANMSIRYFNLSDLEDLYFRMKTLKSSGKQVTTLQGKLRA